ncbi:MAG: tetratricopeptide repeat protein [Bacteroidetes bacterium]|nr:tetratricopeptide repeat protein [Bacteroidota bacterium]
MSFLLLIIASAAAQKYKFGDYMQFGRNELQKGQFNKAINYLNSAIRHRPASFEGWFLRGVAKYYLDDFYGAEQDFTESMKFDPFNSEIYHMRAIVRSRQYNFGGAMADYNRAIELNPKNPLFFLNRARSHLFLESWDSCIADCNRAIQLKYKKEDVYLLRGTALAGLEQYDKALADLTLAIKKNPEKTNSIIQRGAVWMELNEPDSAISDFNKAIAINPDDSYAIFNRALARMETSDTTGAFDDLNKVIEISPYNSYAYYNRAILHLGKDDFQNALSDLDDVIALNPDNIIVYLFRGKLKASLNNFKGAIQDFTRAIEIYPDFADAYYERSKVKERIGDFRGAEKDLKFAYLVDELNFGTGDSLSLERQMSLKRLIAFSGEFSEKRNDIENRSMSGINLLPAYWQVLFASNVEKIIFYETVSKKEYHNNVITLANREELINSDRVSIEVQTLKDSLISPNESTAFYLKKANLLADLHDFNSAMNYYDKAIAEDPRRIMAWFGRANTRLKLINLLHSDYDQQYLLNPVDDYSSVYESDEGQLKEHSYEQVLDDLDQVIGLDPEFYIAWYNRAIVKSLKGDYWGAVSDFSKALELNPEFPEASFNKGLILIYLNLKTVGCRDMSQAGEGGITTAYEVLKRFCNQ